MSARSIPLGQVYQNPPMGQIIRFRQLSRTYGAAGVSWWNWQQSSTTGWKAISIGAGNLTGITPTTSTPILKLGSLGDLVVWAQEHLATAGYTIPIDGDYGPATQSADRELPGRPGTRPPTASSGRPRGRRCFASPPPR